MSTAPPSPRRAPAPAAAHGVAPDADTLAHPTAFVTLTPADMDVLRTLAAPCTLEDGQFAFRAGQTDLDLLVIESGALEILNAADDNSHIVTHGPRQFSGDIDLLTGRPAIVNAVARGQTKLLRIEHKRIRQVLNMLPNLSEKLLIALQERRRLLSEFGTLGLKVFGPTDCRDTSTVKEFLYKNFVPFTWYDTTVEASRRLLESLGGPAKFPVIATGDSRLLVRPTLRELAQAASIWHACPVEEIDLAIIGAGPAGLAAAVYAASEGVSTVVLDRLGPGGQAAGSSKIENFIGFPSGLSGTELATRSVLQMLKFGAKMVAPIAVERIEPAADFGAGDCHTLHLDCGSKLKARTVLIAAGVHWRRLEAPGASRFESAGIYHACTAVEADVYDRHDVAVVGAGNSAGQAAMFLCECCPQRQVHLLVRHRLGPGMSDYLVRRIRGAKNITVHEGVEISAVHGERRVERITIRHFREARARDGTSPATVPPSAAADGQATERAVGEKDMPVAAVFVFIGAEPGCSWLPKAIARDKLGYILTGVDALRCGQWPLKDREPCPLETTIPGILAAGDIRAGSTKRVGFAVGDGSLAVTCVHKLTAIRH